MKFIQQAFESYRKDVIPADALDVQVQECRRAFFAGVQSHIAIGELLSDGDGSTTNDMAIVIAIDAEMREFAESVKAGRA
jgi:hypothetical protein